MSDKSRIETVAGRVRTADTTTAKVLTEKRFKYGDLWVHEVHFFLIPEGVVQLWWVRDDLQRTVTGGWREQPRPNPVFFRPYDPEVAGDKTAAYKEVEAAFEAYWQVPQGVDAYMGKVSDHLLTLTNANR